MTEIVKEIFYFYPQKSGYKPSSINKVFVVGEFNEWGKNCKLLEKYKLLKDKTGRWVGVFDVPKGKGFYKFYLNGNTFYPDMKLLCYSTVSTPEWAKKTIWYQIMTDRFNKTDGFVVPNLVPWDSPPDYFNNFGGTLKGIHDKISYLKDLFGSLNNKAIYLNPIQKSIASNHKYWPEDFETIDPQFGTEDDLICLINTLHKENAKIILDIVYNHTGLNHYAFLDILKNGPKSKYYGWYRKFPHLPQEKIEIPILENYANDKPQNIFIENDPRSVGFDSSKETYINIWDGKYRFPVSNAEVFKNSSVEEILNNQPYYKLIHIYNDPNYGCWAGFFEIPELNTRNPNVKAHLFKAAAKWLKMGIDGFRLDVPDVLSGAHEFWQEFREYIREECFKIGRNPDDIYIVGEIWTGGRHSGSFLYGDNSGKPLRFDAIMNYPLRENLLNFLSGEILNPESDSISGYGEIAVSELDENLHKNLGYISWGTDQAQFNVFSSHDTRRLRTVLKDDKKLKAALIVQFTFTGSPTIYYGDEIGMEGGKDPANRATMRWNIYENFKNHPNEASIYNFYKKLITIRENTLSLIDAPILTLVVDNENKVYSYSKYKDEKNCFIVIILKNIIQNSLNIDISDMPFENITEWQDAFSGKTFFNYGKNIVLTPDDFKESFGIILFPNQF